MTTLAYGVLDPAEEELELVIAGHPPALLVSGDAAAHYLPLQGGMALGASQTSMYRSQTVPFPAGSTLVLYTDGLVERRGESIDDGLERLRAIGERIDDVESLCTRLLEDMVGDEPPDDVAVVAARLPPLTDDLRTTWPARPESLVGVRHLLRRWLRIHGASEQEAYDILVSCQEACANAVEHAYGPGRAHFDVDASHRAARIRVTVRDKGRWREPRGVASRPWDRADALVDGARGRRPRRGRHRRGPRAQTGAGGRGMRQLARIVASRRTTAFPSRGSRARST